MTWIAKYDTKKAFKYAVGAMPHQVFVENPSPFDPFYGPVTQALATRNQIVVTNHPRRSWFAEVERRPDGTLRVT